MSKTTNELKREMLSIKSDLQNIGITTMPKELIAGYCPEYYDPITVEKWFTKVKNVWAIKQGDQDINNAFRSIYESEKEVRNIETDYTEG